MVMHIYDSGNMFSVGAFVKESFYVLVVGELSLFKRLFIFTSKCVDILSWW
jgi:hypothetical protein